MRDLPKAIGNACVIGLWIFILSVSFAVALISQIPGGIEWSR